jgi:hypothetical protein
VLSECPGGDLLSDYYSGEELDDYWDYQSGDCYIGVATGVELRRYLMLITGLFLVQ